MTGILFVSSSSLSSTSSSVVPPGSLLLLLITLPLYHISPIIITRFCARLYVHLQKKHNSFCSLLTWTLSLVALSSSVFLKSSFESFVKVSSFFANQIRLSPLTATITLTRTHTLFFLLKLCDQSVGGVAVVMKTAKTMLTWRFEFSCLVIPAFFTTKNLSCSEIRTQKLSE